MKGSIGCPTQIVTRFPRLCTQAQLREFELSKKAKFRLEVFDWYYNNSSRFSLSGKPDAKLTCLLQAGLSAFWNSSFVFLPMEKTIR